MPRSKRNELVAGLFTLAGLGLLLLLIFLMGGVDALFERRVPVRVLFRDVRGLRPGDPVYLSGLEVGTVRDIQLLPAGEGAGPELGDARMRVTLRLPARLRDEVRTNSVVRIDKSLTGSISVLIHGGEGPGEPLPEDETLRGRDTAAFTEIAEDADRLLVEGRAVVERVTDLLDSVQEDEVVGRSLRNIAQVTESLRQRLGPLGDDARETLRTLRELLGENRQAIRNTLTHLEEGSRRVDEFVGALEDAPQRMEESLAALREAASEVSGLVGENRATIDLLVEDLGRTAENAEALTADVKRRPWRLLYRPDVEEMRALELYDAAWAYNLGASELHRSILLLTRRLEADTDGEERQRLIAKALDQVRRSLEAQREAEEEFWRRLESRSE